MPFWRISMECLSGERTKAIWPSRGGRLMVTDMNLWNPLFLAGEYRRRKRAAAENAAFAREQNFGAILL